MPLLSSTIYLLVIALSNVAARAVDTNITSLATSNISSSMPSNSSNVTASSESCTDIKTCRTLSQIVVSCLVTIIASIWFAVHRNIPAPAPQHPKVIAGAAARLWSFIVLQMDAVLVIVVALLVPEWILAWAVRQAIAAWKLAKTLEKARLKAEEEQMDGCSNILDSEKDEGYTVASADGHLSSDGSATAHTDSEDGHLIKPRASSSAVHGTCKRCKGNGNQCHLVAGARRVAKGKEGWKWSHGFFGVMGGFYFYNEDGPLYPLSPANILELVERGHLIPPTAEEISDKSKGDTLSKGVAIAQTLWFVVQCIARRTEHLPATNLEAMTLAYTVMTVAMYTAWWAKPLNVNCVVRVPEEEVEVPELEELNSLYSVIGFQDVCVDLRQCTRVPTFWAGKGDGSDVTIANVIAIFVAMAFGAVHCIAWHSEFQSQVEQQLWRSSTITIIAAPLALFLSIAFGAICGGVVLTFVVWVLSVIMYIAARIILITLSFTSLRGLPFAAYQTVQWTTFIPHM